MAVWAPVMAVEFQVQMGCQSNCTFGERCCLRGIIQKVTEQDHKCPHLGSVCIGVCRCTNILHMHARTRPALHRGTTNS